jgi:hypothetical protein
MHKKSGTKQKEIWQPCQIWNGWQANRSRSGRKKQKRGLVNDLALLKKKLWSVNFAKKSKKTPKNKLRQAPSILESYCYDQINRLTG